MRRTGRRAAKYSIADWLNDPLAVLEMQTNRPTA
jgi:hypothetical protein